MLWLQFLFWKVTNYSKEFIDKINCMSGKYSRWAIFQDLITMMAISMANACDKRQAKRTRR